MMIVSLMECVLITIISIGNKFMSEEENFTFQNNNFVPPEENRFTATVSVSGIFNWFKKKKKQEDIDNIKRYEETILESREGDSDG